MRFMEIDPQPARGKLTEEMWDSPDWIAEEKYDGERRIAQFCGRVVRFTGRKSRTTGKVVEKTEQLPHLSNGGSEPYRSASGKTFVPPASLDGTVLDGELICGEIGREVLAGGLSKLVTSIANSLPAEAVRKQIERGWLRYVVFDCLFYKGKDLRDRSLTVRRKAVTEAVLDWGNPFVSASLAVTVSKRAFLRDVYKRGGEGVILKHLDHLYGDEKRWVKVKKLATADVVIIGFKMAKATSRKVDGTVSATKYAGKVGSVEIGQYVPGRTVHPTLIPVGFARGFDDAVMEAMTLNPKRFIGKVITIEANDREPTGKFRHPRVLNGSDPIRTDKDPKSCIFDLNEK